MYYFLNCAHSAVFWYILVYIYSHTAPKKEHSIHMLNDVEITNDVINRIDALRYECGYSISKLADLSDIPESTLKSILSRKSCPKILTIYKLCDAFGITVWQFFLFPNKKTTFTKEYISMLNKLDTLGPEQKQVILSAVEAFYKQGRQ